ncbi:MAG: glycerate kinase [Nitrospirota bacterium]|jgi:hydroxypyruvate reductase/glycerate 2-kinase
MTGPKEAAKRIFRAALDAADPYRAVAEQKDHIEAAFRKGGFGRLVVVGFGKASAAMASAVEDALGDLLDTGMIITKYGHLGERRFHKIRTFEAGHPVPDDNGQRATEEALGLLKGTDENTLVLCLVSGGGSALLSAPAEGISLSDKQAVTTALLKAGADINELNAVRKHISGVKGGRLARAAYPAAVLSLLVSDVIGDFPDVIASGPTAPDTTTWQDAIAVIEKYGVEVTQGVADLLRKGAEGSVPDSPKPGDIIFQRVENIIVGSNRLALSAAGEKAESLGFSTELLTSTLRGEAREAARWLATEASRRGKRPACLIAGGETTVTVRGTGKGGRNTELALAFSLEVEGMEGITLLSAGTDGTDGPTDAAGAVVDGSTARDARQAGVDPREYLDNNDSYTFFERAGGLLKTGPTGTNVMDVDIILLT